MTKTKQPPPPANGAKLTAISVRLPESLRADIIRAIGKTAQESGVRVALGTWVLQAINARLKRDLEPQVLKMTKP